jgi:hypothetical protein
MKVFFGLLLIVNIAFAVFQWLMPYEQLFVERKKIPAAEQLQLLTDANTQVVSERGQQRQTRVLYHRADQGQGARDRDQRAL